jgi:hypothetical protein
MTDAHSVELMELTLGQLLDRPSRTIRTTKPLSMWTATSA